jgi:hypothetical protein
LGIKTTRTEVAHSGPLPQHFGDEFGWEEMVRAVATVYDSMSPKERARTGILAGNYGEAGAIDFFGSRYGLPSAISAHQNYYFWGPRQYTGESLILLQWSLESARRWCRDVQEGPTLDPQYTMGRRALHNPDLSWIERAAGGGVAEAEGLELSFGLMTTGRGGARRKLVDYDHTGEIADA